MIHKVVLQFPDARSLAEFVIKSRLANAEVKAGENTLTTLLSSQQIQAAAKTYSAFLKSSLIHYEDESLDGTL